jgi:hypothetical protein
MEELDIVNASVQGFAKGKNCANIIFTNTQKI